MEDAAQRFAQPVFKTVLKTTSGTEVLIKKNRLGKALTLRIFPPRWWHRKESGALLFLVHQNKLQCGWSLVQPLGTI